MGNVFAARTVATFAADVPLADLFGVNVVANGVAAVARGACGALHIASWIERGPPISSSVWHMIGTPGLIPHVPLGWKRIVVISHFGEVALLPLASIDKGNLVPGKRCNSIGAEIRDDCIRVLTWIAHDISHRCLFPTLIDVLMACLTGL